MRSQLDRDEQTVTIAATLALFVLVLLLGVAIFSLVEWAADPSAGVQHAFSIGVLAAAASIGLWYLVRHRRR